MKKENINILTKIILTTGQINYLSIRLNSLLLNLTEMNNNAKK